MGFLDYKTLTGRADALTIALRDTLPYLCREWGFVGVPRVTVTPNLGAYAFSVRLWMNDAQFVESMWASEVLDDREMRAAFLDDMIEMLCGQAAMEIAEPL